MSKVTKKQLQRDIELLESGVGMNWSDMKKIETRLNHAMTGMAQQLEALEEFATYADNMLTELNHALPDPEYDAKCEAAVAGVEASLDRHRERLGLNKPQLKQLDQSIFNGLDEKWRFAAVDLSGEAWVYRERPKIDKGDDRWSPSNTPPNSIGICYDTSNWQNSLIERDIAKELLEVDLSSELTGSDLAVKYFESNERHICFVGEDNDGCLSDLMIAMVVGYNEYRGFMTSYNDWFPFVTLINNQGEPLTASEVGL